MPRLVTHRKLVDKIDLGSMDKLITLYSRNILPYNDNTNPNFLESLTNARTVWASVECVKGVTVFDSVSLDRISITDEIYLRYQPDYPITIENWVLFDGNYYKIITVDDLQSYKTWLKLQCVLIGDINKASSLS
jgi:head-tail adaptor